MTTKKSYTKFYDSNSRFAVIDKKMQSFNYDGSGLLETLITAQEVFGHLSNDLLAYVAKELRLPLSQVWGVATFYDKFKLDLSNTIDCQVCIGPVCEAAGAREILAHTCKHVGISEPGQSSDGKHRIEEVQCLGLCDQAPAALVNKKTQVQISKNDVPALLKGEAKEATVQVRGKPRVLTASINRLDPTDLETHQLEGTFAPLEKAINEMTPSEIIKELKTSRLTGRGGAGFLTGLKWELAMEAADSTKYIVCNFDESEPGTFKDRVLMEGNPFSVIEGLMIGALAIGAKSGYIFIRNEYHKATSIVVEAIEKLYSAGLLGEHILGSEYDLDIEVRHSAGGYICGEETALFEAIEGKRGIPRIKPPYPTQTGLFGKPTVINNVETLAVVPNLIEHGGEWFQQWGTHQSVGLKLFCLSGDVNQPCVVEAPYGLTIRRLINEFGGGFVGNPQAILIGGAAGGFLHPDWLDLPVTHEDLRPLNVPVGSGAIMVFNQSVDLWKVVKNFANFFEHETCGHCVPCRLGTKEINRLLDKINHGRGTFADIQRIETIGEGMSKTCYCGLGLSVANPVLTFLHNIETSPWAV
ncbi:MAG TPA: NAD(P)H-dependent oxidoreductase subunit E [Anaerolineales bacterium]|nr:NAD(P)H-dependent oxidoreductase subunit E [Anaerolineales bacterium]